MARLFGTDGVRGVFGKELTCELAFALGEAGAKVLSVNHKPKFVIGRDTRVSGSELKKSLIAGIEKSGGEVVCVGILPTPAIAYLTRKLNADAGIVISASHNPYEYNGIKFFNGDGFKLSDEIEDEIERILTLPSKVHFMEKLSQDFTPDLLDFYSFADLSGLKIALDCANGAAYILARKVFESLGAEVAVIGNMPNGININKNCGSTHLGELISTVKNGDFDFGLAFDGDADRMLAVDENGCIIDGDQIMAIIASFLKDNGQLNQNTLVATVMSNIGLHKAMEKLGINVIKADVGDRYVLEEMQKGNYNIGGEQSGHVILLDKNTTGDGILTGIFLSEIYKEKNIKMSELASIVKVYPQVLVNAKVPNDKKHSYNENENIKNAIKNIELEFHGNGRVLIRPSGTENLVRVMLEGDDEATMQKKAKELADLIEAELNQVIA